MYFPAWLCSYSVISEFLAKCHRRLKIRLLFAVLVLICPASNLWALKTPTLTTLTITENGTAVTTISSGAVATFTATVRAGSAAQTPGQVRLCDATIGYCTDAQLLGTGQLNSSGQTIFRFIPAIGDHKYKAEFIGTSGASSSESAVCALNVTGVYQTTTTITANRQSGNLSFSATVASTSPTTTPSGTVNFIDETSDGSILGTATLAAGNPSLNMITASTPKLTGGAVARGDFNGDGKTDLVTADGAGNVNVALGNGDGTFRALPPAKLLAYTYIESIVTADFNSDGIADLAINGSGDNVTILIGVGDGTFVLGSTPFTGKLPQGIAVGDWNQDGIPDLAIANDESNDIAILLGVGDGTFMASTSLTTNVGPGPIRAGDFNNDGKLDLVVVTYSDYAVMVYLGNGDGTFTKLTTPAETGFDLTDIAVGDFNRDGRADIAVSSFLGEIDILLGRGDGTFANPKLIFTTDSPGNISVGDFNGDGKADIAIADGNSNGTNGPEILLGQGDGTFSDKEPFAGNFASSSIATADFNGDGETDIVYVSGYTSTGTSPLDVLLAEGGLTSTVSIKNIWPVGNTPHQVEASYSGDTAFAASVSPQIGVEAQPLTTALTLTVTPSKSSYGQQVVLSATLNPSSATGVTTNSEPVIFFVNGGLIGTGTLVSGVATLNATSLPAGTDSLTAIYNGDSNFTYASSPAASIQVNGPPAVLTSPMSGATLSSSATFQWAASTGATAYQLWLGTVAGSSNLYNSHGTLSLSETVTGLPTNGGTIFATLFTQINGVYQSNAYTFIASGTPSAAVLTSPAPGGKLSGTSANFTWAAGIGVTAYQLWLGSTPGANNIFNSGGTTNLSATVTGLPSNGGTIYATLFSLIDGAYKGNSYAYIAVGTPALAELASPIAGSTFTGSSTTFTWTAGTGVTNYQLWLGTTAGANNLYNSRGTYNNSATVTGLPTNGGTIFASLFSLIDGVYKSNAYTYIASGTPAAAALTTPTPGVTLSGSSVTFDWTAGTGVTAYQLWVGTTAGASDLYNSHGTAMLSATAAGLPANGKTIYVTLFSLIDGAYKSNTYAYTAEGP